MQVLFLQTTERVVTERLSITTMEAGHRRYLETWNLSRSSTYKTEAFLERCKAWYHPALHGDS